LGGAQRDRLLEVVDPLLDMGGAQRELPLAFGDRGADREVARLLGGGRGRDRLVGRARLVEVLRGAVPVAGLGGADGEPDELAHRVELRFTNRRFHDASSPAASWEVPIYRPVRADTTFRLTCGGGVTKTRNQSVGRSLDLQGVE